jgi:hypothetical protein
MSEYATVVQTTGRPGKAATRKSGDLPKCSPYPGAGGAAGNGFTVAVASFAVCGALHLHDILYFRVADAALA